MNFQFKNWKAFREQLKSQDIKIATFDFVYEKCEFKIIYCPVSPRYGCLAS